MSFQRSSVISLLWTALAKDPSRPSSGFFLLGHCLHPVSSHLLPPWTSRLTRPDRPSRQLWMVFLFSSSNLLVFCPVLSQGAVPCWVKKENQIRESKSLGVNVASPNYRIFALAAIFHGHLHAVLLQQGTGNPWSCRGMRRHYRLTTHNLKVWENNFLWRQRWTS